MKTAIQKRPTSERPRLEPVALEEWPKGLSLPIAQINLEPDQIEERQGIRFANSHDELDFTRSAIIRLPSRACAALVRHRNCPSPGTEIWIEEATVDRNRILHELLHHLGVARENIIWLHPTVSDATA